MLLFFPLTWLIRITCPRRIRPQVQSVGGDRSTSMMEPADVPTSPLFFSLTFSVQCWKGSTEVTLILWKLYENINEELFMWCCLSQLSSTLLILCRTRMRLRQSVTVYVLFLCYSCFSSILLFVGSDNCWVFFAPCPSVRLEWTMKLWDSLTTCLILLSAVGASPLRAAESAPEHAPVQIRLSVVSSGFFIAETVERETLQRGAKGESFRFGNSIKIWSNGIFLKVFICAHK